MKRVLGVGVSIFGGYDGPPLTGETSSAGIDAAVDG